MTADSPPVPASVTLHRDGPVATIRFANKGKRNAFTWSMYEQLGEAVTALRDDRDIRVVVLRGDAVDGFAAGTEIDQFRDFRSATDGVEYERRIGQLLDGLAALPMPTIAAVQRSAVGAGLAIAAMCDLIIADQGAVFGAPIARTLGNCLSIRVVAALRQRLGASRTQTMLLTARLMTAESLAGSGFVAAVAAAAEFEAEVAATAERIASLAPLTLRSLKEMARRIDATELPDDTDLLASCYGSTDFHEGVGAFLEHRPPQWTGH